MHEDVMSEGLQMTKLKNKNTSHKNKNNKTKPENLLRKEYMESYEELKKSIRENREVSKDK
jgi:hypothetical protein